MSDLKTAVAKDTWPSNVTVFASSHRSEESKMNALGSHYTRNLEEGLTTRYPMDNYLKLRMRETHGDTLSTAHSWARFITRDHTPQQSSHIAYLANCSKTYDFCHGFIVEGQPNEGSNEDKVFAKDGERASRIMTRMGVPDKNKLVFKNTAKSALEEYLKKLDDKYKDAPDRGKQEVYLYFTGHGLAELSESGHLKGMQYLMDKKGMDERDARMHMYKLHQELDKAENEKDAKKRQQLYKEVFDKYAKIGLTSDKDFEGKFIMRNGTVLRESELKALVKKHCKDFGKVVIIMDSCHSGSFTAQNNPNSKDKDPLGRVQQRDVLC